MNVIKVCKEYCIGCGLCHSELGIDVKSNIKGFLQPEFQNNEDTRNFLRDVCPIVDTSEDADYSIWGKSKGIYAAFAKDEVLRKKASSGGVISALAIFLLENGFVDGIIHVKADEKQPTQTVCRVSTTREEIEEGCGSRYSISSPWLNLSEMTELNKRYVAIGKPCDIKALRRLKQEGGNYSNIIYLFSFFCAGLPSKQANERLLQELGCVGEECKLLTYRGNGWPGYATAIDRSGKEYMMEYSKAWGGILGRDVHPYCRVCFDGIGEAADVACGDGWYISENQTPDFSEREGRNIVFVRTELGEEIYQTAVDAGAIVSTEWENINQLHIIQKYQFTRRTTIREKLLAYRMFFRRVPLYNKKKMIILSMMGRKKEKARIFLGTAKRIFLKKI